MTVLVPIWMSGRTYYRFTKMWKKVHCQCSHKNDKNKHMDRNRFGEWGVTGIYSHLLFLAHMRLTGQRTELRFSNNERLTGRFRLNISLS